MLLLQSTEYVFPRNPSHCVSGFKSRTQLRGLLTMAIAQTPSLIVTQKSHVPYRILHTWFNNHI